MHFLKRLLWPFSLLYGGIMVLRNALYDFRVWQSCRFDIPVLAVGNLTVGGTGKTPHVEYLIRLLKGYSVATLSRGYKRQTKGFLLADASSTAATLGDEPFQYYRDFRELHVAVCEDRVAGIEKLRAQVPDLEVVVLDDAMQHRPVQPSLNLMLTDYQRPFYKDLVLPAGLLREPRGGAKRADAIIVSKCPDHLGAAEQAEIRRKILRYARPGTPIFFTRFAYGAPMPLGEMHLQYSHKVVLLTGIANANPLKAFLTSQGYQVLHHLEYPDHHQYTTQDLKALQQLLAKPDFTGATVLTTRKDAVKLADPAFHTIMKSLPVFYLPIAVGFMNGREEFDRLVLGHVQHFRA